MHRKSWDLYIVSVVAIVTTVLILTGWNDTWSRLLLGLPLVLVLPGYTLTHALFPRRTLTHIEQPLYILGLSLIVVVLAGLIINMLPRGLQASSWVVMLALITIVCAAVADYRRPQVLTPVQRRWNLLSVKGLLCGLTAVYVAGTLAFAHIEASQSPAVAATQLWALAAGQTGPPSVRLGINNGPTSGQYKLQIQQAGFIIQSWPALALASAGRWETTLVLPPQQPTSGQVEILLYRSDVPTVVYRRVTLSMSDRASK